MKGMRKVFTGVTTSSNWSLRVDRRSMIFLRRACARRKSDRLRNMLSKSYCSSTSTNNNNSSAKNSSAILRSDYRAPCYLVPQMQLDFDLDPKRTIVRSRLHVCRAPNTDQADLVLDGIDLQLESIKVTCPGSKIDKKLSPKTADYILKPGTLTIPASRLPTQKTFVVRNMADYSITLMG